MNEVGTLAAGGSTPSRSTSSKGPVDIKAATSGKDLPEVAGKKDVSSVSDIRELKEQAAAEKPSKPEGIGKAIESMERYVQSIQRDLHFTVDEDLEQTIIKVIDRSSGELIRQIPDEVFLELARKLNDDGEFQLINALG